MLGRIVIRHKDILEGNDVKDPNFYLQRKSERKIMEIWAHVDEIKKDSHAISKFERELISLLILINYQLQEYIKNCHHFMGLKTYSIKKLSSNFIVEISSTVMLLVINIIFEKLEKVFI